MSNKNEQNIAQENATNEDAKFDTALAEVLASIADPRPNDAVIDASPELSNVREIFETASIEKGALPSAYEVDRVLFRNGFEKRQIITHFVERASEDASQRWKVEGIYDNYAVLKRYVSHLVSKYEGGACSVDKAHSILNTAVMFFTGKRSEEHLAVMEQWNQPTKGTLRSWIAVVEAYIEQLYRFDFEKLIEAEQALAAMYSD